MLATSPNNWARWERGHTWPDSHWLHRIYRLMDLYGSSQWLPGDMLPAKRSTGVLSDELREYRQLVAHSQAEAAAAFGVAVRTWKRWESGMVRPDVANLGRLHRWITAQLNEAGVVPTR